MPYLSIVGLRIEIERALWRLMALRGIERSDNIGIGQALRQLRETGGVPAGTDAFLRALVTMNKAAHGLEVEPSETADTLRFGSEFLAQLRKLTDE
jgi:hypothetical protein